MASSLQCSASPSPSTSLPLPDFQSSEDSSSETTLKSKTHLARPANLTWKLTNTIWKYVRSTFGRPSWKPTLSREMLEKLHVQVWKLDLDDPYTSWAQPVPLEQVAEWLKEKKPWQERGYGHGWMDMGPENSAWWNADSLKNNLSGHAHYGETALTPGIMYEYTKWSKRLFLPHSLSFGGCMRYEVSLVLKHEDKSLPHITGVLTQDFKLDDRLTVIELFAMANLTDIRILDGVNPKDARIPVTLISIGDCNMRVLHGCFDGLHGAIYLQVSRIMNFYEPDGFKTDDWKRALAWLLATPTYEEPTDEE